MILTPFYIYAFVIIAMIIGDILSKGNPARQLLIDFSSMGITCFADWNVYTRHD